MSLTTETYNIHICDQPIERTIYNVRRSSRTRIKTIESVHNKLQIPRKCVVFTVHLHLLGLQCTTQLRDARDNLYAAAATAAAATNKTTTTEVKTYTYRCDDRIYTLA